MYKSVCVCVCCFCLFSISVSLIFNFNVIRHAIQTNRGSTHTYGSLLRSASNRHRRPATQHQSHINKATRASGHRSFTARTRRNPEVCLNGMALLFSLSPGADEASAPVLLSQFLCGLRLLLGHLLLRHDGHPRRHRASDGLLGHVVVVDEGEEAAAASGALRQVPAVHPHRHAATLLLQGKTERSGECLTSSHLLGMFEVFTVYTKLSGQGCSYW